jgi:hypothetical protein
LKYKLVKNVLEIIPENPMDHFWIGKMWGKYGGMVEFVQPTDDPPTDDPQELRCLRLESDLLFKILTGDK